jgi:23S rRNA-/tRNA-specific pseudouridylate synthase
LRKPRAVHRLDSPTGGLLVIAKTRPAESSLRACFANRTCHKRYRAIVFGKLEMPHNGQKEMIIDHAMDGGKSAVTRVQVVQYSHSNDAYASDGWLTTVDLFPITGRTHQLRKHMKYVGHPIWGDRRYGPYRKQDETTDDAAFTMEENESEIDVDHLEATTVLENPHCKLCLWALEISFPHPLSGESTTVSIDEPEWYKQLRSDQALRWQESQHHA